MPNAIDTIITAGAPAVRKQQFLQQLKMTQNGPAQIAAAQTRLAQSVTTLKSRINDEQVVADLGADYETVKAAVEAL